MSWWQFSLECEATELEQVEDLMQALGALSISIGDAADEPIYEPLPGTTPVWQSSTVTATFESGLDPEVLQERIAAGLPGALSAGLRRSNLEERDWEQAYRRHFQPIRCAPGLWIVPSWLDPPEPGATVIRLDPGLAFGTGTHPTTALCLDALGRENLHGRHVLDYGCGSGILAIAAARLGAARVTAVDIDPQALDACRDNLERNGIGAEQASVCAPETLAADPVDLLVANILAGPLVELASRFAGLLRPGGRILLSGILKSQLAGIQSAYGACFELEEARGQEDWICIGGRRTGGETDG